MRKITCYCDREFDIPFKEVVDIDQAPEILEQIENAAFQKYTCPYCGAQIKKEFRTRFLWPSRQTTVLYIPENERIAFYNRNVLVEPGDSVVIGFPELLDRMRVIREGFDPLTVEAVKFHLLDKARQTYPGCERMAVFRKTDENGALVFYLYGAGNEEVAMTAVPFALYEKVKNESGTECDSELFSALQNGAYTSVQNISFE